jgi:ferritin-like metal-binding protein YciE
VSLADALDRAGHALLAGSAGLRRRRRGGLPVRPPAAPPEVRVPTISHPRDLYLAGLAEILWVERLLVEEVLPRALASVQDPGLSSLLAEHLEVTRGHAERAERAFGLAQAEPRSEPSRPFLTLARRGDELCAPGTAPAVGDLNRAVAALATELYEIGTYRALELQASALGQEEASELLARTRVEEEEALDGLDPAIARLADAAAVREVR